MEISTSILSVKEEESVHTFYRLETAHTDYYHIDVMDGKFVEANTIDKMQKYADELKNITNIPMEVHLMVEDVRKYVDLFLACSPRIIYFHIEALKNDDEILGMIQYIKNENCMVGLVVNPETDIEKIYKFLPKIHNVLVMSVHPGKGGQDFIESSLEKISSLRKYIDDNKLDNLIEVDGGIDIENAKKVKEAGADYVASGSYIVSSKDYKYTINKFKEI